KIARPRPLQRAIGDRAHRFPHRDVLVRDACDAGMTSAFHRFPILQVVVLAGPDAPEVAVEIDTHPRAAELAPGFLLDAPTITLAPCDEVEHGFGGIERDV